MAHVGQKLVFYLAGFLCCFFCFYQFFFQGFAIGYIQGKGSVISFLVLFQGDGKDTAAKNM
ncbi:MAG: hypothetical protein D5S00_02250 [Tindallia sp. MSAO_Bac2]|nr:MAG: hypothetical protein D5S00_02250 [Tindallia sp. MSAO_Bac2]